ncbi:aldo/keto reductase [Vulcanisaeta souniana]|uniref:Aldo/keto reductase n=2 Tax=Vulcanisaeta souniana TaxID=164452 RepID=A0A830E8F7_9CREN|nr:aldo/keto reductase [Vulcanisaeta souniana]BDR92829.1 aldo/keto reductase [Vulcanisaeta souniana JCM 11219]GGI81827.1 aldo/keto reductase [Vulcanisaeta souniana JCM 11219]
MEYRVFGKTGVKASIIGMGTYYDPGWIVLSRLGIRPNYERRLKALRVGMEGGINFIDTAEIYGSEPLVGEAIRGFDREELFIATKVWPTHLRYNAVIKAAKKSLKRLGVKYIDLYQIHFPNRRVPITETMRAMECLVDNGLIRFIGLSNFNLGQVIEAQNALKKYEIASIQMPYSLVDRRIENDIIPYTRKNGMAVIAYYPLGHGKLISRFPRNALETISRNHGPKTVAQIVLNWIISKHEHVFPIPRASNPDHVGENLGVAGWRLTEEEIKYLEGIIS